MTRVLVADDHPAFRRGLELMLGVVDDVEIVGFAETGAKAVELTGELSPDVVLMDLRMPDLDGIEATRRITRLAAAHRGGRAHDVRGRRLGLRGDACRAPGATCSRAPTRTRSCERSAPLRLVRRSSARRSRLG